jgi:hypothetical protein
VGGTEAAADTGKAAREVADVLAMVEGLSDEEVERMLRELDQ